MTRRLTSRVAAGFSAAAIALVGFGTGIASAADDGVAYQIPEVSSIDQDTGNLHITKLTPSSTTQQPGNGTQLSDNPDGSKPINNVNFTAKKVDGIDLKTNEGWKKAAAVQKGALDDADAPTEVTVTGGTYDGMYNLEAGKTVTTAGEGVADFSNLPVGMYLVYETIDKPVNIVGGEQNVPGDRITKAKPFFVTIPMTNPDNRTEWMYDIYAYPKNELAGVPTKKVDDDAAAVGSGNDATKSTITYTLSATVPSVAKIKRFELVDKFKTSQLEWINSGADDVVKVGTTILVKGTDFNFSDVRIDGDYSFVAVEITEEGLTKLAESHQGETLSWTFYAKVKDTTGATLIPNTPYLNEGPDGWTTSKPGQPGPEVKTYYGKVTINKKNESDQPLEGAKFALYECSATGFTDPLNSKEVAADWALEDKNRVSVDGVNEWTSASGGVITIDGLLVNDFRNNSTFVNGKDGDLWKDKSWYCLKEIKAPEGYELLPNPVKFQVTSTNGTAAPVDAVLEVHNNKTPGLPVTGGAGIAILVAGGVLLLSGSAIYAFVANRKRKLQ